MGNTFDQFDAPAAQSGQAARASNVFDRFDAPDKSPGPDPFASEDAATRKALEAEPAAPSAGKRIQQAVTEGYGSDPVLSSGASDWLKDHHLGLVNSAVEAGAVPFRALSAGIKGGQQAVEELGDATGYPLLARDIAALPEALLPEAPEGAGFFGATRHNRALRSAPMMEAAQEGATMPVAPAEAAPTGSLRSMPAHPQSPEQAALAEAEEEEPASAAVPPAAAPIAQPDLGLPGMKAGKPAAPEPIPAASAQGIIPKSQPEPAAKPSSEAPSGGYAMVDPDALTLDPKRFQYKTSDERGVTGALQGVSRWQPDLANPVTAWQDNDGVLYVVNGHQRTDLAQRAKAGGQDGIQVPAKVFREADGYTPEYMRALGAYQNIAEGSGTAIDAARVLRSRDKIPADRALPDLPPRSQMVQQATGLAALDDHAFGMVENGIVPPAFAAYVGQAIKDPAEQVAALDVLAKGQPANAEQARFMVDDIRNSGFLKGAQTTLFGDEAFSQSLFPERARVLDNATRAIRRAKSVFRSAVDGEDTLAGAGNTLSREGNVAAKADNERLLDYLQRNATTRGPLSDALSDAARDLASGKPIGAISSRFLVQARALERRGPSESIRPRDLSDGAGLAGEGEAGEGTSSQSADGQDGPGLGFAERGPRPESRWASATPGLVDELPNVRDRWGGAESAAAHVVARGRETGHEHLAVVDSRTGEIVHAGTSGKPNFIPFDPQSGAEAPDSFGFHHNHPSSSSLSENDVAMMASPGLRYIAAHGHDGSVYAARLGDRLRSRRSVDSIHQTFVQLQNAYRSAAEDMRRALTPLATDQVAVDRLQAFTNDVINHILHAKGVIDYFTTKRLPEDIAGQLHALKDRGLDGRSPPDRPAELFRATSGDRSVRAPDGIRSDMARSSGRSASGSGREDAPSRAAPLGAQARLLESREGLGEDRQPSGADPLKAGEKAGQADLNLSRMGATPEENIATNSPTIKGGLAEQRSPLDHDILAPLMSGHGGEGFETLRAKTGFRRAMAEVKSALSPTSLEGAKPMEFAMRRHGAEAARSYDQAVETLSKVRDAIDRASKDEQIDFTDRMERGLPQPTPELQAVANALRGVIDGWTKKVQSLGRGVLANAIDNYMGHVWGNYREWAAGQQTDAAEAEMRDRATASGNSKRPLLGSRAFLKQRVFPFQKDAIDAGLIPITHNPVDLQLLKVREMQKFYHGSLLSEGMKTNHLAHWVPQAESYAAESAGFVRLDDRVFQPRLSMEGVPGKVEPGNWYAPEPVARLFNNYMSRGLQGQSILYDTFRAAGNALNSMQLGISGFHATFVTMDTMISRVALGLHQLLGGSPGKGATSLLLGATPLSVAKTISDGSKLRQAWLVPEAAGPMWRRTAQDLAVGGGRISMDTFYRNNASGTFLRNFSDMKNARSVFSQAARQMFRDANGPVEKAVMVPLRIAGRVLDTAMQPLMGAMVPRAKLGVFSDLARDWHDRNPLATPEQRADAMTKFWDSTENRLGQMTYDNVFWNKAFKDIAFITERSVGWNLGTIRELGGAVVDYAKALETLARGKAPAFTTRMAYALAMPGVTALYGAMLTYLSTGQPPQSRLDYFFPPTGVSGPDGAPQRRVIPSYVKDVIEYTKAPVQTLLNKTSPLVETGEELYHNRDYYGGIIDDPIRDSAPAAYADYLLNQVVPFSIRGAAKLHGQGASMLDQSLAFWGIQPAPQSITDPDKEAAWRVRDATKAYRSRAREPGHWNIFTQSP